MKTFLNGFVKKSHLRGRVQPERRTKATTSQGGPNASGKEEELNMHFTTSTEVTGHAKKLAGVSIALLKSRQFGVSTLVGASRSLQARVTRGSKTTAQW